MTTQQITNTILMVRPNNFGYNAETAANNAFQQAPELGEGAARIAQKALQEFDAFVTTLRQAGVQVLVMEDDGEQVLPDAVFPNNWFTTHADGLLVTYPMFAPTRRLERRDEVLDALAREYGVSGRVGMESYEAQARFLEGTGSFILDRDNQLVYACRSIRTDEGLLNELAKLLGYTPVAFDATDADGQPIYHTNVMMALGTSFCVICLDSLPNAHEREQVEARLRNTGKEIIAITLAQMNAFAGNMLQVRGRGDSTYLVMSERAYRSLTPAQIARIEAHTTPLYSNLETIENHGGGSARCMMAEIFLPRDGK